MIVHLALPHVQRSYQNQTSAAGTGNAGGLDWRPQLQPLVLPQPSHT